MITKLLGCTFCIFILAMCNRASQPQSQSQESIRLAYRAWVVDMERRVLVRADITLPDGSVTRIGVEPGMFDDLAMQLESSRLLMNFGERELLTFLKSELTSEKLEKTSPLLPGLICAIIKVDFYDAIQQSESIVAATNAPGDEPLVLIKPFGPKYLFPTDVLTLMERLIIANELGASIVSELQLKRLEATPKQAPVTHPNPPPSNETKGQTT